MVRFVASLLTLCVVAILAAPFAYRAFDGDDRLARLMQDGQVEAEAGDWVAARLRFEQILAKDPENLEARLGLARALRDGRLYESAATHLIHILRHTPDMPAAQVEFGELLFLAGHLEESRTHLEEAAVTKGPLLPRAQALAAAHAAVAGDDAQAETLAKRALDADPSLSSAYATLATVALREEAFDAALDILDRARGAGAETLALGLLRLGIYETRGTTELVGPALQELTTRFPETPELKLAQARWLAVRPGDNMGKVRVIFDDLLREYAGDPVLIARLTAEAADLLGPEGAFDLFETVASQSDVAIGNQLAVLEAAGGDRDAAIARLTREIAVDERVETRNASRILLARLLDPVDDLDRRATLAGAVLETDPDNPSAHILLGEAHMRGGSYQTAISHLRAALSTRPDETGTILQLARAHALSGSTELAQDRLAKAMRVSGYAPEVALRYARLLEARQGPDSAAELLEIALASHPTDRDLLVRRAEMALAAGDVAVARAVRTQLVAAAADDALVSALDRAISAQSGGLDETIAALRAEFEDAPTDESGLRLGAAYLRAGEADSSVAFLDDLIEARPDWVEARLLRADARLAAGAFEDAVEDLDTAAALAPSRPGVRADLARLQLTLGKQDAADATIAAGLAAVPDNYELAVLQAYRMDETGESDAARLAFQHLAAREPDDPRVAARLARLLVDGDQTPETRAQALRLTAPFEASDDPTRRAIRGWVLYCSGDSALGRAELRGAALALPGDAAVQARLGFAELGTGDLAAGREALQRAAELAQAEMSVPEERLLAAAHDALDRLAGGPIEGAAAPERPCGSAAADQGPGPGQ